MALQFFKDVCSGSRPSFYSAYHKTFDIVRAETEEQAEEVFRLRYQVYCKENGYIDPKITMRELERDIYDRHSLHCLLIHRKSGRPVGTARVVLPRQDKPLRSFPLQSVCDHPLLYDEEKLQNICEISRLCMSKAFRQREADGSILPAYTEADWEKRPAKDEQIVYFRRMIPYAPLGLIMGAFELAIDAGITDCFCVMDKTQLEAMEKIGLTYEPLGKPINFHGLQQPVLMNIGEVLQVMKQENEPCWDIVSDYGRLDAKHKKLLKKTGETVVEEDKSMQIEL
jgi:N-acyl amino acid synthase of PEP-CTERM/exosortase system